jgi:hypothetical protein
MKKKQATRKKSKRKTSPKMFTDKHMKQTGKAITTGAGLLFSGVMLGATIDLIKKHT